MNSILDRVKEKRMFTPKQKSMILDPLTTIIRLSMLNFKQPGTKTFIHNNTILFNEPMPLGIQGAIRWFFGDGRDDLHNISRPIQKFIRWYLNPPKEEEEPFPDNNYDIDKNVNELNSRGESRSSNRSKIDDIVESDDDDTTDVSSASDDSDEEEEEEKENNATEPIKNIPPKVKRKQFRKSVIQDLKNFAVNGLNKLANTYQSGSIIYDALQLYITMLQKNEIKKEDDGNYLIYEKFRGLYKKTELNVIVKILQLIKNETEQDKIDSLLYSLDLMLQEKEHKIHKIVQDSSTVL